MPDEPVGRRRFVRSLAGDAVGAAGKLAGWGGMVHGSMAAAGRSMMEGFGSLGDAGDTEPPVRKPEPPVRKPERPAPRADVPQASEPRPAQGMTPEITAMLDRANVAVIATNESGHGPHLTFSRVSFDGTCVRIAGRMMTARVANLQRDPQVSLSIRDEPTGDTLLVAGRATLLYGEEAAAGCLALGTGDKPADSTDAASAGLGQVVLIVITPQRVHRRSVGVAGRSVDVAG